MNNARDWSLLCASVGLGDCGVPVSQVRQLSHTDPWTATGSWPDNNIGTWEALKRELPGHLVSWVVSFVERRADGGIVRVTIECTSDEIVNDDKLLLRASSRLGYHYAAVLTDRRVTPFATVRGSYQIRFWSRHADLARLELAYAETDTDLDIPS